MRVAVQHAESGGGTAVSQGLQLPTDLYSPDQLGAIIIELRGVVGELRDGNLRARGRQLPPEVAQTSVLLTGVMHNAGVSAHDVGAAENLLAQLQALRPKLPVAHLTLADLPSRALKRRLTEWFRSQIHPNMLVTFAVRADIGGGIIVQGGSRLYDFSFRQHVMQNRQRIGELFADVRE